MSDAAPQAVHAPRVACVMLHKDEDDLLEPWLLYYGALFGYENLFIFDNGSTSKTVRATLRRYAARGVTVDRSYRKRTDFPLQGDIAARKIRQLAATRQFDFFLPVDCDEFVVLDGPDGPICDPDAIRTHFASFLDATGILEIKRNYTNYISEPARFWPAEYQKVFFARHGCTTIEFGYHRGKSALGGPTVATRLAHMHFHHKPFATILKHTSSKLDCFVNTTSAARLRGYRGPMSYAAQYFLMTPAMYYARFEPAGTTTVSAIIERLKAVGCEPFWERWAADAAAAAAAPPGSQRPAAECFTWRERAIGLVRHRVFSAAFEVRHFSRRACRFIWRRLWQRRARA